VHFKYLDDQIKEDEIGKACRHMGEMRNTCHILVGKPKGKNHLEDLGTNGKITLE
jgi:hypothetical protein